MESLNILIDAMGGDNAPEATVIGAVNAVNELNGFNIILFGVRKRIDEILEKQKYDDSRIKVIHTEEIITNDESPTKAIRQKKDSSMSVGFDMLKVGSGDVLISAGSTGALMAGGLLKLGRIKGIDRPALPFYFPGEKGPILVLDAGANTVCKPINYLQFGIMGAIYMKDVFSIENPEVGLINVGSEDGKGNETIKQAYSLLEDSHVNFVGNIEGRDIPEGKVDVAVCDGFVGNVLLKFAEGIASYFFKNLKELYTKNVFTKLSGLSLKGGLRNFKKKVDYTEYGGVPLLGIKGKVIKCHGSSNEKAIKNAVLMAVRFAKSNVIEDISDEMIKMEG